MQTELSRDFSIVEYSSSHLAEVTRLQGQLGYMVSEVDFQTRIEKLKERGDFNLLVLLESNTVVGFIAYEFLLTLQYDLPICHIMNLVVDSTKRGNGYGWMLLKRVKDIGESRKVPILHLTSGNKPERIQAHQFYEKFGFSKTGSRFTLNFA